jgi:hypothetical protein
MPPEFYRREFSEMKVDYLLVIIGSLDEYFGGYNGDDELKFFVNEKECAKTVYRACLYCLSSLSADNDARLEVDSSGFSSICSPTISKLLHDFFDIEDSPFLVHRRLTSSKFPDLSSEQKFSYFIGVYIRHFKNGALRFANAWPKVYRTHQLLCECSDDDDVVIMESHYKIPHSTAIKINPDHPLLKAIELVLKELRDSENRP